MPTQLPMESTDFFGNLMMPYALDIINSDATKPLSETDFKPSVYGVSYKLNFQYVFFFNIIIKYFRVNFIKN